MIDTFFNTFNNHLQVSIIASSTTASLSCKSLVTFQERETGLLWMIVQGITDKLLHPRFDVRNWLPFKEIHDGILRLIDFKTCDAIYLLLISLNLLSYTWRHMFSAVGEPPITMSCSCLFAVKHAVEEGRKESGNHDYFTMSKYTVNIQSFHGNHVWETKFLAINSNIGRKRIRLLLFRK
jgi:hypothetical protein